MINREERAVNFEILITECQAVCAEVQGMRWENEQRLICNQSIAYDELAFQNKANELRSICKKLRKLLPTG